MHPLLHTNLRRDPFHPLHRDLQHFVTPEIFADESERAGLFAVDMDEDDEAVYVEADLAGFRRDEIDVQVDDATLTITAEREPRPARKRRHLNERRFTRAQRRLSLPVAVDRGRAEAAFEDGVLTVTLPKSNEAAPHRVDVR